MKCATAKVIGMYANGDLKIHLLGHFGCDVTLPRHRFDGKNGEDCMVMDWKIESSSTTIDDRKYTGQYGTYASICEVNSS